MFLKRFSLTFALSLCFLLQAFAQAGMTDSQVIQFMMKEQERGTNRSEIVTKLIEKGVPIEQIRRIQKKYEKQQNGSVVGAKDISGVDKKKRTRTYNGEEREDIKGIKPT